MLTSRVRGQLVLGAALLLIAVFALRFLESPLAAWSTAHAELSSRWDIAALTAAFSLLPMVLQIVALSLASAALLGGPRRLLPSIPFLWAAVQLLLAWLGRPELRSWASAHLPPPLWRLWAELYAGQVSPLSHGFGARQVVAALLGAALASAALRRLRRQLPVPVTRVTLICVGRPAHRPARSAAAPALSPAAPVDSVVPMPYPAREYRVSGDGIRALPR